MMNSKKIYMIIGATKHGKTTFINKTLGTNLRAEFNGGKSVTIEVFPIEVTNNKIFGECLILDTPGMPDTERSDKTVANEIITGLLKHKANNQIELDGIIFIQRFGEAFNLTQYNTLLNNLSTVFKPANMMLIVAKTNSSDEDER
jgi:GTPase Era involved in 16S rRNA processing